MKDTCTGCPYGARLQEGDFCFLGAETIDRWTSEPLLVYLGQVEGSCPEIDRYHVQALRRNAELLDEEEATMNAIDLASSEEEVDDLLDDLFAKLDE